MSDNYVETVSEKKIEFTSLESAGLFILMCCGIDEHRRESYRYKYSYPKRKGRKYEVTITDFGE